MSTPRMLLGWRTTAALAVQFVGLLFALGYVLVGNRCGFWGGLIYLLVMLPVLAATIAATVHAAVPPRRSNADEILSISWSPLISLFLGSAWVIAYLAFVPTGPFLMYRMPACGTGFQGLVIIEGFLAVAFIGLLTTTPALLRVVCGRVRRPGLDLSSRGVDAHGVFRSQQVEWSRVRSVSVDRPAGRSVYGGFKVKGAAHLKITQGANLSPVLVPAWPCRLRAEEMVSIVETEREYWARRSGKRKR